MIRLLLKFTVGVFLASLLSHATIAVWMTESIQYSPPPQGPLRSTAHIVASLIRQLKDKSDPEELERFIEQNLGNDTPAVALVSIHDLALDSRQESLLRSDGFAFSYSPKRGPFVVYEVDARRALLSEIGHKPPPFPAIVLWISLAVLAPLVGFVVALPLVRRIGTLKAAAERIGAGDLSARVHLRSNDIIGQMANRFDAMADRIERLLEEKNQLVQAVSHELRTPVARMRFSLEMLKDAQTKEERDTCVRELEEEIDEVVSLVDELMSFIKYDAGQTPREISALQVVSRIRKLGDQCLRIHSSKELTVLSSGEANPELQANCRLFDRVFTNLLSNALRHAKSRVRVEVHNRDGSMEISVNDDGPGIPDKDREAVFEPFTRLDSSRDRRLGGMGLGLALVSRIMRAGGGDVYIADSPLGGAKFVTIWPVFDVFFRHDSCAVGSENLMKSR